MSDKQITIVKSMQNLDHHWDSFLESTYSNDFELLRWGQSHRVYKVKDKVIKIEKKDDERNPKNLGLEYEYKVLKRLKNTDYDLNPKLSKVNNIWELLEIDFIEGELLELNSLKKNISLKVYGQILWGLFIISIKGIKYKQFRGRHIIKNKNNEIKFIDFGQAEISNSINSFLYNFKLFSIHNKKVQLGKLLYFFYFNYIKKKKGISLLSNAKKRFLMNKNRLPYALPDALKQNPGDQLAPENLKLMELKLNQATQFDENIYLDILDIKFDKYGLSGNKDWGFIWNKVSNITSFKNKIIMEIFCCQAAFSSFAILQGAKKSIAADPSEILIEASKSLAKALDIKGITFFKSDKLEYLKKISYQYSPDMLFACSYRLDNYSTNELMDLFLNFKEVFWDTNRDNIDIKKLNAIGFNTIKNIVNNDFQRTLVYLSRS